MQTCNLLGIYLLQNDEACTRNVLEGIGGMRLICFQRNCVSSAKVLVRWHCTDDTADDTDGMRLVCQRCCYCCSCAALPMCIAGLKRMHALHVNLCIFAIQQKAKQTQFCYRLSYLHADPAAGS